MTLPKSLIATAAALLVAVPAAHAQRRDGGHARGGAVVVGRAAPRGPVRVAPRVIVGGPGVVHGGPVLFSQPYYTFRPRVSLGFGLWLGYPVRYTSYYGYYNPYYY